MCRASYANRARGRVVGYPPPRLRGGGHRGGLLSLHLVPFSIFILSRASAPLLLCPHAELRVVRPLPPSCHAPLSLTPHLRRYAPSLSLISRLCRAAFLSSYRPCGAPVGRGTGACIFPKNFEKIKKSLSHIFPRQKILRYNIYGNRRADAKRGGGQKKALRARLTEAPRRGASVRRARRALWKKIQN